MGPCGVCVCLRACVPVSLSSSAFLCMTLCASSCARAACVACAQAPRRCRACWPRRIRVRSWATPTRLPRSPIHRLISTAICARVAHNATGMYVGMRSPPRGWSRVRSRVGCVYGLVTRAIACWMRVCMWGVSGTEQTWAVSFQWGFSHTLSRLTNSVALTGGEHIRVSNAQVCSPAHLPPLPASFPLTDAIVPE